jgi:hypothetical protein
MRAFAATIFRDEPNPITAIRSLSNALTARVH